MTSMLRRGWLWGLLALCLALAPAAAFAAKSPDKAKGPSSSSNSILLGKPKASGISSLPSVFSVPTTVGKKSEPQISGANWLKKIVWTPPNGKPVVLPGRDPKPDGAIPEPGAALLFVFGAGLVALHLRSRPVLVRAR